MAEHSPLGGSGAHRWLVCPGSVSLSRGIPNETSEYALEGTAAHHIADTLLRCKATPWDLLGTTYEDEDGRVTITREILQSALTYVINARTLHPKDSTWLSEYQFHCENLHLNLWSTADFVGFGKDRRVKSDTIHIHDFKHGAGIIVEVEDNVQLMYYAVGVIEDLSRWHALKWAVLHIHQPRSWHPDGVHRSWRVSIKDLRRWCDNVLLPGMERTETEPDVYKAGSHCRFCPAAAYQCPATMDALDELEDLLKAKELTPAQITRIFELEELAKIVFSRVKGHAAGKLKSGNPIEGLKLVPGKKSRVYKRGGEAALRKKYGKLALKKEAVLSPAEVEAQLPNGRDFVARWSQKPPGVHVVALADDKRPAVRTGVAHLLKARKD